MEYIGKAIATIGIMAACAYVGVETGNVETYMGGATTGCVLLWIFA